MYVHILHCQKKTFFSPQTLFFIKASHTKLYISKFPPMKNKTLASHISQYTNTLKNPPSLSQNLYQMSETNKDSVPKIIRIILMDDEEELNAELKKYDYSINTAYCGKSPLYYAIQFNSERCVKILLDREAESDPSGHRNRNQRRNKTPKHTECYHRLYCNSQPYPFGTTFEYGKRRQIHPIAAKQRR